MYVPTTANVISSCKIIFILQIDNQHTVIIVDDCVHSECSPKHTNHGIDVVMSFDTFIGIQEVVVADPLVSTDFLSIKQGDFFFSVSLLGLLAKIK